MHVKQCWAYKDTPSRWGIEDVAGVDRNRGLKQTVKAGATAANVAISSTQLATGGGALAMATGVAAVSATGVGLVAVGGAMTIGSSVFAARSAYKTYQHRTVLQDLDNRKATFICKLIRMGSHPDLDPGLPPNPMEHAVICDEVLPYIISKKTAKFRRKAASSVPGVGLLEGIRAVGKKGYKWWEGTLGVNRTNAAQWLAMHLITHKCQLAIAIVDELYSAEECEILRTFNSDKLLPYLMDKMKST